MPIILILTDTASGVQSSKIRTLFDLMVKPDDKIDYPSKNDLIFNTAISGIYEYGYNGITFNPYIERGTILGPPTNNQSGNVGYKTVKVSQTGNGYSKYDYFIDTPYAWSGCL
jgi:hypothetical protein